MEACVAEGTPQAAAVGDDAEVSPEAAPEKATGSGRRRDVMTNVLLAVVVVLTVAGLALPDPVCLLAGVVGAAALFLRRWLPGDVALPLASVALVVVAALLGLAADVADVDLFANRLALPLVWSAAVAGVVVATIRSRQAPLRLPVRPAWFVVAQLPAAVAAGVAVVQQLDIGHVAAWMFFGTDFAEHALLLEGVQRTGMLDYGVEAYPRGAHALLSLISLPGLPETGSAALLSYDLRLLGAATWLGFALLLWTMSAVVLRVGAFVGLPQAWRGGGAFALGALVIYDALFSLVFVVMASIPGLMAAVALVVVPLVASLPQLRHRRAWLVGTAVVAVVAIAHLWPALLPVPVLALAVAMVSRDLPSDVSDLVGRARRHRAFAGLVIGAVVLAAAAAAVPILALLRGTGFATAAVEGGIPPPHLLYTGLGVVAACVLAWRQPRTAAFVGAVAGAIVTVAVLLWGAGGGLDIEQYYPRKAIWFLGTLVFPLVAVLLAAALRWCCLMAAKPLDRLGPAARVARISGAAVLVAVFVSYGLPLIVVGGSLAQVAVGPPGPSDQRKIQIALEHGHEFAPAVTVPIGLGLRNVPRESDTYMVSKLLRFKTGQPQTFGHPDNACAVLREVAGDAPAVVLTDVDEDVMREMMRRQGCAGPRIVQVPGVHPGVLYKFRERLYTGG